MWLLQHECNHTSLELKDPLKKKSSAGKKEKDLSVSGSLGG